MPPTNRKSIYTRYSRLIFKVSSAVFFALLTYIFRLIFFGSVDIQGLYLTFLVGVIISAWLSGFLYGLVTSFVSLLFINFFFLSPNYNFLVEDPKDLLLSCVFIILAIIISFLGERMHEAVQKSEDQLNKIKEMRADLRDSAEKIQILMDSIGDAFININSEGEIIYINHEAENLFRKSKNELRGKSLWKLFPGAKETSLYENLNRIIQNNEPSTFDHFFEDENKWLEIHTFPTVENSGMALYLRDVTINKKREEKMRQNEAYYKKFVNSNVIGIVISNIDAEILDVNDAFLNTLGYSRDDFKSGLVNWESITPEEFKEKDLSQTESLLAKGVTDTYEKNYIKKDGTLVQTLVARIMIDQEKGICLSYVLDISERKQNEERLKESELRFRNMADNTPGMIWMSNSENLKHYFNKRWLEYRGRTFEEEYGNGWMDGIHDDDKKKVIKKYEKAFAAWKEFEIEYRLQRSDGVFRWVFDKGIPRFTSENRFKGFIGISLDITERKEVQEQLKESKDQLQIIFQNVADAVTVQDKNGRTLFINDKAAEMLGYNNATELIEADPKKLQEALTAQFVARDESGKIVTPEELPGAKVLKGEEEVDMIFELYNKIEKKGKWYLMKSRAVFDESKKPRLAVNILTDITDSKEREKRKDEFMSIASHELKTPITTIKAFTQILLSRAKTHNDVQNLDYLIKMDNQVNNLTNLVSDLLDVSRIQAGKMSLERGEFDVNILLNDTLNNLQMTHPSHKLIKKGEVEAFVNADRRRIEQVLVNLINNGVKYSPNADKIDIEINKDDKEVSISVKDYGIGINKNDQKRIFRRFYVSEENKENRFFGLGLGLFISLQIIKRHKGAILVESEKGVGSKFTVKLPLSRY